jgi:hypothetical protein
MVTSAEPTVLEGFQILEQLASGSTASVYRARHTQSGQLVVLKLYPEAESPVLREFRLLQQVAGPQVVRVVGITHLKGQQALVIEDFGGEALPTQLAQGTPDVYETLNIVIQVADAVAHLHTHSVIHGQLQTSSLVYNAATGELKLTGLAVARQLEQGLHPTDAQTDLQALGHLLRELLAGTQPPGSTAWPEHTPTLLAQIGERLIRPTPGERYFTAEQLATDLRTALERIATGKGHVLLEPVADETAPEAIAIGQEATTPTPVLAETEAISPEVATLPLAATALQTPEAIAVPQSVPLGGLAALPDTSSSPKERLARKMAAWANSQHWAGAVPPGPLMPEAIQGLVVSELLAGKPLSQVQQLVQDALSMPHVQADANTHPQLDGLLNLVQHLAGQQPALLYTGQRTLPYEVVVAFVPMLEGQHGAVANSLEPLTSLIQQEPLPIRTTWGLLLGLASIRVAYSQRGAERARVFQRIAYALETLTQAAAQWPEAYGPSFLLLQGGVAAFRKNPARAVRLLTDAHADALPLNQLYVAALAQLELLWLHEQLGNTTEASRHRVLAAEAFAQWGAIPKAVSLGWENPAAVSETPPVPPTGWDATRLEPIRAFLQQTAQEAQASLNRLPNVLQFVVETSRDTFRALLAAGTEQLQAGAASVTEQHTIGLELQGALTELGVDSAEVKAQALVSLGVYAVPAECFQLLLHPQGEAWLKLASYVVAEERRLNNIQHEATELLQLLSN